MQKLIFHLQDDGNLVYTGEHQGREQAEKILKACNMHEELVAKLQKLVDTAGKTTATIIGFAGADELDGVIDEAIELLQKAKA